MAAALAGASRFDAKKSSAQAGSKMRKTPRRPNILWIVAENMGPDLGCYGTPLVHTPNVDRLADEGMRYALAFDTAPVCSASRSAFMTGMYQTAIGAHNHRSHRTDFFPLPAGVRPLTHRLRDAGYYTANIRTMGAKRVGTGKTDLNFDVEGPQLHAAIHASPSGARNQEKDHNQQNEARLFHTDRWDDLRQHQPFYAQVNLPFVEKMWAGWDTGGPNSWYATTHPSVIDPDKANPPPYYPDHPVTRRQWARYLDGVCWVDQCVGEIIKRLAADGLADDTVVVFFADNGRLTLRGLDWCYDSGDRVPLIVRWPKNFPAPRLYEPGLVSNQLVSLIDVTATTLDIAGINKPSGMQGRILLGPNAEPPRRFIVSARDRCDDAVNRIRSVRTERYRYIRNFMPEKPFMALHRYKAAHYPIFRLMVQLHDEGKLTSSQRQLMAARLPDEELYDVENDPYEINNLADSTAPEHRRILKQLRGELSQWIERTDDHGRIPESREVIEYWTRDAIKRHGTPDWYKPPR
jgi:arylsulfatase A-like enzyme